MSRLIRWFGAALISLALVPAQLTASSITSSAAAPSWEQIATPGSRSSEWVAFFSQQRGWLYTDDTRIWRTSDGGSSWISADAMFQAASGCTDLNVLKPSFVGSLLGWAPAFGCGQKGWLFSTTDGGNSWRAQEQPPGTSLESVDFQDAQHGWASGATIGPSATSYFVAKTNDGGAHWTQVYSRLSEPVNAVRFLDQTHGVAVLAAASGPEQLMSTSDGGATWVTHTPAFPGSLHYVDLAYPDSGHVYAAAHTYAGGSPEGFVDRSSNHGATWDPWIADFGVGSLAFLGSSGWAAGGHTSAGGAQGGGAVIAVTSNAGATWARQYENASLESVNSIFAVDACHAWAAGGWSHPFLLRYSCAGPAGIPNPPPSNTRPPTGGNPVGASPGGNGTPTSVAVEGATPAADGTPSAEVDGSPSPGGTASFLLPANAAADKAVTFKVAFAGANDQPVAFAQDSYAPLTAATPSGWSAIADAGAANCAVRFQPATTRSSTTGRAAGSLTLPAGCHGVFHVSATAGGERLVAQITEAAEIAHDDRPVILAVVTFAILNIVGFGGATLRRRRRRRTPGASVAARSTAP